MGLREKVAKVSDEKRLIVNAAGIMMMHALYHYLYCGRVLLFCCITNVPLILQTSKENQEAALLVADNLRFP
jgi:hypothetical protein